MSDHANPTQPTQTDRYFWQDLPFWLAVLAGPICWSIMSLAGLGNAEPSELVKTLLWVALIYPVLEEIVFRSGLQTLLLRYSALRHDFAGISVANVLTSITFAGLHLINQSALWAALVFFPSLVFGWARDRYGNIIASILLHMFYNAGFVVLFLN